MSVGTRKVLLAALVLVCMTSVVIVRTMRLTPMEQEMHEILQGETCLNYMQKCVPWEGNCCNGMKCMNYGRGFCMFGLESCICQMPFDVDGSLG